MVAGRIIAPEASKLGMTQSWADTTLADDLGLAKADEDELYEAMDWLVERQGTIEKRLSKRHLKSGGRNRGKTAGDQAGAGWRISVGNSGTLAGQATPKREPR